MATAELEAKMAQVDAGPPHFALVGSLKRVAHSTCVDVQASMTPSAANSNSPPVFPYSASYGRTMIKTLLLAADGGRSMVSSSSCSLQGLLCSV
jgi:hypothetical protein